LTELTVIAHAKTKIGTIYLAQREPMDGVGWIYEMKINGKLLMSSVSPVSEKRLATSALSWYPGDAPLRVLVGGLGLGYTACAALEDPRVASVRVVEKMQFVIDWMDQGLLPLSEQLAVEERIEIVQGDVYSDLLGPVTETYDLILVDVDHAPDDLLSPVSEPFYTVDGQRRVARHLRPCGVLGVWSASDNDDFAGVLGRVYLDGHREEVTWPDTESPDSSYQNVLFFARASLVGPA
jgi:spermidine synthase